MVEETPNTQHGVQKKKIRSNRCFMQQRDENFGSPDLHVERKKIAYLHADKLRNLSSSSWAAISPQRSWFAASLCGIRLVRGKRIQPHAQHTGIKHIDPSSLRTGTSLKLELQRPCLLQRLCKKIGTPQDRDPGHSHEGVGPGPQLWYQINKHYQLN